MGDSLDSPFPFHYHTGMAERWTDWIEGADAIDGPWRARVGWEVLDGRWWIVRGAIALAVEGAGR